MAGGIGVTPMIAMAHRLHALGRSFGLHYSCRSRNRGEFSRRSRGGTVVRTRCICISRTTGHGPDLGAITANPAEGAHLYTCGPDRYMTAVLEAAEANCWPEDALHREYFSVPELPEYENHEFTLKLVRSGRSIPVPADKSATDALAENGIHVDTKCSDGICGVCVANLVEGEVEHRDFVLAKKDRDSKVILCCSRAAEADATIAIDL